LGAYTKLTRNKIDDLMSRFGVAEVTSATPMAGGLANTSYLVRAGAERLVLTVCDDKELAEVRRMALLLAHLEQVGFPATRLVRRGPGEGGLWAEHRGKAVLVKRYVAGEARRRATAGMLRQIGAALADLHHLDYPGPLPERHPFGLQCFAEASTWQLDHPFVPWLKDQQQRLEQGLDPDLPRGLIHADACPDNVVFHDGQLAAVIDFEDACRYYLVTDLALCIAGSCVRQGQYEGRLVSALLQGYQERRQLTPAEAAQLPLHVELAATSFAFWRFRQFNMRSPDPERAQLFQEMVDLAQEARLHPIRPTP